MYNDPSNENIRDCLGLPEQEPPYSSGFGEEEQPVELEPLEEADDIDDWMERARRLIETMPDEMFTEILDEILGED